MYQTQIHVDSLFKNEKTDISQKMEASFESQNNNKIQSRKTSGLEIKMEIIENNAKNSHNFNAKKKSL